VFDDRSGPMRSDIAELHDRFDHWTKRERRRAAVERQEQSSDQEDHAGTRRERLAQLQGEIMRRRRGI
jgi:hypothetical protein